MVTPWVWIPGHAHAGRSAKESEREEVAALADGVNRTLWPGFSFEYWARTRRARRGDYQVG